MSNGEETSLEACKFLGVHPHEIERAGDVVDRVCSKFGLDPDDVWNSIKLSLCVQRGPLDDTFTDHIIAAFFRELEYALAVSGACARDEIDWCSNGMCSMFCIGGEEQ